MMSGYGRPLGVEYGRTRGGFAVVFTEYKALYRVAICLDDGWHFAVPYADKRQINAAAATINGIDAGNWFAQNSDKTVADHDVR